jgi:hypothetical protein
MHLTVPDNQTIYTTPFTQSRFYNESLEYGAGTDASVYLSRLISDYTKSLTDTGNAIVTGFKPTVESTVGSIVTFKISPGKVIQDYTLLELHEEVLIDIDVTLQPTWLDIILVVEYKFANTVIDNPYKIHAYLYDGLNDTHNDSSTWDGNTHNVILGKFTHNYDGEEITNLYNSSLGLDGQPIPLTIGGVAGVPANANTRSYSETTNFMLDEGLISPFDLLVATGNTGEYPGFGGSSGAFWWILGLPVGSDTDVAYVAGNIFNNEF